MAGKEQTMLWQLSAQLNKEFNGTFSAAQKVLTETKKQIIDLNSQQGDIKAYERQQEAVRKTGEKLELFQKQLANVKKEQEENGNFSSALANKEESLQLKIKNTAIELEEKKKKLSAMGEALKSSGKDTENLGAESERLKNELQKLKQAESEAAQEAQKLGDSGANACELLSDGLTALGAQKLLREFTEEIKECTKASIAFESALTGVAKTTDFTADELEAYGREIKSISNEIPKSTEEIAAVSEAAGQLGIAKKDLREFSETMVMLGTATNMTSEESATMLAQFASVTRMNPQFYGNLGAIIVDLGNNFSTTERNITEMGQTIAAVGAVAGMSEADIMAIAAAVTSLGISSHMGGTQIQKLVSDINSAVGTGEGLQAWAEVAGVSAEEFGRKWKEDAAGGLDMFIRGLNSIMESGQDVYGVLDELGIKEARMQLVVTSLAKAGDRLTDTLNVSKQAWEENSALTAEAEKRYGTTESKLQLLNNAQKNLQTSVGDIFIPELKTLIKIATEGIKLIDRGVNTFPSLTKGVVVFTGGALGLVAAMKTLVTLKKLWNSESVLALRNMGKLNGAMAASPTGLLVVGIAAVAAALASYSAALKKSSEEQLILSDQSEEHRKEIKELTDEYEKAKETYGESSREAQNLKCKIDGLNEAYTVGKKNVREYLDEIEAQRKESIDIVESREDELLKIKTEEAAVFSLISRLKTLAEQNKDNNIQNAEAVALIQKLNELLPSLKLNYDDVIYSSGDFGRVAENIAKAEYAAKKYKEVLSAQGEALHEADKLEYLNKGLKGNLSDLEANLEKAALAYDSTVNNLSKEGDNGVGKIFSYFFTKEGSDFRVAQKDLKDAEKEIEKNQQAIDKFTEEAEGYKKELEEIDGAMNTDGDSELATKAQELCAELGNLQGQYTATVTAAEESFSKQFSLWDKADEVTAVSVSTMTDSLKSQRDYWTSYSDNLEKLKGKTGEVEGLADVLSELSDGSKEDVAAIAGFAAASTDDLKKLVKIYNETTAARKQAAADQTDLTSGFAEEFNEVSGELKKLVGEMDKGEEAKANAESTINSYIEALKTGGEQAIAQARSIANSVVAAFGTPNINVETQQPGAYASGVINAEKGLKLVGENGPELVDFKGGERVYNNGETKKILSSDNRKISITVSPSVTITGKADSDTEERFTAMSEQLVKMVIDGLEEAGIDRARRSFAR